MHDTSGEPTEKKPGRSTGPTTPDGKRISSLNRLDHGCRSEQLILPTEDPAEFEFTLDGWFASYPSQDATLVFETAKAHWFLKRNEKRLHQVESSLPADPCSWTSEHHKSFQNFTRYKTTAERTFFRWYRALEIHHNREIHRLDLAERARARAAALNIQWLNKQQQKAAARDLKIDQYVRIDGDDEVCATTLAPTNERIKEIVAERPEPPKIITRYLMFSNGVPPAYRWMNPGLVQREFEIVGIQTMLYSDWLGIIQQEQSAGTGHVGPAPSLAFLSFPPNLPDTVPA
jgi:hypothetical protein